MLSCARIQEKRLPSHGWIGKLTRVDQGYSLNGVNQAEIAKFSGVSRSTVAFALNPKFSHRVHQETRQRVMDAAERLGYRPHRLAQTMRQGRSGTIGMIQFSGMTQGATRKALQAARLIRKSGYHLLASDVQWYEQGVAEAWDAMVGARVEGLLLITPSEWLPTRVLDEIALAQVAVVSMSGVRFPGVPQVRSDIQQGSYDLTMHLLRLGHRRLTMLTRRSSANTDETHSWPTIERVNGFHQAIQDFQKGQPGTGTVNAEVIYEDTPENWSDPYQLGKVAMKKLLTRGDLPDVVLCRDDNWAMGALAACAEAKVRVPDDVALTGFGNDLTSQYGLLPLTTVASPTAAIAQEAVRLLVEQIQNPTTIAGTELTKMPCELVVRQSCGAMDSR